MFVPISLHLKVPIMTFVNEVTALILMKLLMEIRSLDFLKISLDRYNHPEHHELGLRSERVGPREGGQVHEAEPLGRDAGGGWRAGGRPPRSDPIRSSVCNSYCTGERI